MLFQMYENESVPSEVVAFLDEHLTHSAWSGSAQLTFYVLHGDGGTVNRYTEELEGQTILAVGVVKYMPPYSWLNIAVHPDYRRMGLARRLLRRVVGERGGLIAAVPLTNHEALGLALRDGEVQFTDGTSLRVSFNLSTVRHLRCHCAHCQEEMAVFTQPAGRVT